MKCWSFKQWDTARRETVPDAVSCPPGFPRPEAPSPRSSSAEDHAPELVLSKTAVDSVVGVVPGKDEADNDDFG